ncbi:MAG TPA: hypothetical protein VGM53_04505 [Streptosporangiaceae bacterium]
MSEVKEPASRQPEVGATAAQLRVDMGAFKRRAHEAASEGDLTGPQLTALSRIDRLGPSQPPSWPAASRSPRRRWARRSRAWSSAAC